MASRSSSSKGPQTPAGGRTLADLFKTRADRRARFQDAGTETLAEAIDHVIDAGAGLILSRTSDGGAIAVTILMGTARVKAYAATQDELDEIVTRLLQVE